MASSNDNNKGSLIVPFGIFLGTAGAFTFRHSRQKPVLKLDPDPPAASTTSDRLVITRRKSFTGSPKKGSSWRRKSGSRVDHHFDADTETQSDYDFKHQDITHICESGNGKLQSGATLNPALNGPKSVSGEEKNMQIMASLSHEVNENSQLAQEREGVDTMPCRITLIRHGQSEGNIDSAIYQTKPDNALQLTELGWVQARMAGQALRGQITKQDGDKSIHFVVSPYVRTMETFHGIASAWCDPEKAFGHIKDKDIRLAAWYDRLAEKGLTWHEDPRIREQDFGNYQDINAMKKAKTERWEFSAFYYRFLNGESASDVFDRVSTFRFMLAEF